MYATFGESQLRCEQVWFSGIPTIAQGDEDGVAREQFFSMALIELLKRFADFCTARPTRRPVGEPSQRIGQTASAKKVADLDDIRAEEKCMDVLEVRLERVCESKEKQAVEVHRAADVEKNDQLVFSCFSGFVG